ncbi:MAG: NusG domain II-containing protein [Oscillospiraceae bacterium]|nr:NusG domain II-containing protein [Oscillospiraceae bacterium]
MKKKVFISVCIGIILIGVIGSVWAITRPHGDYVQIVQDGMVLYRFDLSTAEDQTIDIEYSGRINTVQIESGKIRMLSADCRDHTCVKMGWLNSAAAPIVCLPNHLVIEFADSDSDLDAVV